MTVAGSLFYLPFLPLCLLLIHLSKIEEGEVKSKCPVKEYDSPDVYPGRGKRSEGGRKEVRSRRIIQRRKNQFLKKLLFLCSEDLTLNS